MAKRILVTGDYGTDCNVYRHSDADNPPTGTPPSVIRTGIGGAGILHSVLSAAGSAGGFDVDFATSAQPGAPTVAAWHPVSFGNLGKSENDKKAKVWRTQRSVNLGALDDAGMLAPPSVPPSSAKLPGPHDVVVIEDNAGRFRLSAVAELGALIPKASGLPGAVVLTTSWPFGHGPLWWHLTGDDGTGANPIADRLVVIARVKDIRKADVRISSGISWERTTEDLIRELSGNPALAELRRARFLIVTFGAEGALLMARGADGALAFTLCFDAMRLEDEWSNTAVDGDAAGLEAGFVSAVSAAIARGAGLSSDALLTGISRGLLAMRVTRLLGHGPVGKAAPSMPTTMLGELISTDTPASLKGWADAVSLSLLGQFGVVTVPASVAGTATTRWRILESSDHGHATAPLYGKARRIALFGATELRNVPCARFGKLITADRDEIESLRNLKRLMEAYAGNRKDTKPLSLAVFGPPGAGKSFGIKEIAESVLPGNKRKPLEFNLSQFKDAGDLIGAFHQVRDYVLEGELPVVFWDEFDSRSYEWLQYLLAPMQDGKFQEGQLTHPIGRCIFVFAGATSYTFEHFGPSSAPPSKEPDVVREHREAVARFTLRKGPDFKSRLHGTLNVLGPNPRQIFTGAGWVDDPTDVCFPVRRAILLRSLLGLMDEKTETRRLDIDPGLLAALLETPAYSFGSRSFEKIVASLRGSAPSYQRSALPSDEVLGMNVEPLAAFKAILDQSLPFQQHADTIAAAVHAQWLTKADAKNAFKKAFELLDAEAKADNRAAAWRIPAILGLVGLELAPSSDPRPEAPNLPALLEQHLETLAEAEHDGWMTVRLQNGWTWVAHTDDTAVRATHRAARRHDCLIPYAQLSEHEKDKDRGSIRWYPELARLAGFKMVVKGRA